jgi:DNA-binding SARP family transcriptional activator
MEFGVLGPLLVRDASGPLTVGSAKQRALLATLLLESAQGVVPAQRLIDELWGPNPPATAAKALQVHVSQLRRALGRDGMLVTRPAGYRLELDPQTVDVHRFETLLRDADRRRNSGDYTGALAVLKNALATWRGAALADVALLGPERRKPIGSRACAP